MYNHHLHPISHGNKAEEQAAAAKALSLPCFSFCATGWCSYEGHCKFIHDERLLTTPKLCQLAKASRSQSKGSQESFRKTAPTEKGYALFYWPPMSTLPQKGHLKGSNNIPYDLGAASSPSTPKTFSYLSLVSMWACFLENIELSNHGLFADPLSASPINPVTHRRRLPMFYELSMTEGPRTAATATAAARNPSPYTVLEPVVNNLHEHGLPLLARKYEKNADYHYHEDCNVSETSETSTHVGDYTSVCDIFHSDDECNFTPVKVPLYQHGQRFTGLGFPCYA